MNDLTIFKSKNLPTYGEEECNLVSVSDGMAGGLKFIRLDGKQFVIVDGGVKTPLSNNTVIGVIVNAGPISKRYYKKVFTGKDTHAPDCASANGENPDTAIQSPICDKCETCPMNAWGSKAGYTGKKAKACQEYRRLAVCITDEADNNTIYRMDVPAASLNNLRAYGSLLSMRRIPLPAVLTQITFDPNTTYQKLKFDACKAFTKEAFEMYKAIGQSEDVKDLLSMQSSAEVEIDEENGSPEANGSPQDVPAQTAPAARAKSGKTIVGQGSKPKKVKKVKKVVYEEVEEEDDSFEDTSAPIDVESAEDLESALDNELNDEIDL